VGVRLDFLGLVQVLGAGDVLEVDHVREVLVGEPQDAERADHGRVGAGGER
jgi:hypothetical protein